MLHPTAYFQLTVENDFIVVTLTEQMNGLVVERNFHYMPVGAIWYCFPEEEPANIILDAVAVTLGNGFISAAMVADCLKKHCESFGGILIIVDPDGRDGFQRFCDELCPTLDEAKSFLADQLA